MSSKEYHLPVLLHDCLNGLLIDSSGIYVDVTFGGGGHSNAILEKLDSGRLIGFDQDADALQNVPKDDRFTLVPQNFKYLKNNLRLLGCSKIDGIIADLGVSSHQFDIPDRGFSIRFDAELDMRMDQRSKLTAAQILNEYSEDDLYRIFRSYGEVRSLGRLVSTILSARAEEKIKTVFQFKEMIADCIDKRKPSQYLAQVFQALRIEVNDEMNVLQDFLKQTADVLKPGGRLVVMSYHSLEDRLVKNFIKSGNFEGKVEQDFYGNVIKPFKAINTKVITPSEEELKINNRARSAKLRIAEKL
ncbi:MAG: 16S rRNA (cytosine(1402)-N(4))-methyltransferase RsmH [Flavobacteriales bacterium]|nr:16S rRNA (cytosine(1402)-N(4))-methyltransferase RsmH [Flavobacteriales bacterium]